MDMEVQTAKRLSALCPNLPNKRNSHKRIHGCTTVDMEKPNRPEMKTLTDEQATSQIKGVYRRKTTKTQKTLPYRRNLTLSTSAA